MIHIYILADKNECELDSKICGSHSACTNNEGSYKCNCESGFTSASGDGKRCIGKRLWADLSWLHCLHFCSLVYELTHRKISRIYIPITFKNWKSWFIKAVCKSFSALQSITKEVKKQSKAGKSLEEKIHYFC